jgi:hypothetical protein
MSNPYKGLASHHFWRAHVGAVPAHRFDPVVATRFRISREDRVATAGSCFAQHISRELAAMGFNFHVTERGETLSADARAARQYGIFSARYGNIYTARQLLQLTEEAFGHRVPLETAWRMANGKFADPYRPSIEPEGFESEAALIAERTRHLAAVREALTGCHIFVFTLGLTEAWRSRRDGAVFPIAPGVVAGDFDPDRHEFINLTVEEVAADMAGFLDRLKSVNPGVKVILTVSPVPLAATFEDRSVVQSTTYSKSVLRVAADMLHRRYDWLDYFPSYEIITGGQSGGLYYEDDRRTVNDAGVAHAMRVFRRHYTEAGSDRAPPPSPASPPISAPQTPSSELICDEETIELVSLGGEAAISSPFGRGGPRSGGGG